MGGMESHDEIDDLADAIGSGLVIDSRVDGEVRSAADAIEAAKKIVVLSGAGISVSAGIPDFRTPGTGLYDNLQKYDLPFPEAVFDVQFYQKNPKPFVTLAMELWPGFSHSPTKTHSFLKLLSDRKKLLRTYTQNIDGLEHLGGIPESEIVECHGHFRTASCTNCGSAADASKVKADILAGTVPECERCGGNIKPDIVFFGESLPGRFHRLLKGDVRQADLLIVMGTSLQVAPVSLIPGMVSCPRILLNRERVMKHRKGDTFLAGDCDDSAERICDVLGWTDELLEQNAKTKIGGEKVTGNDEEGVPDKDETDAGEAEQTEQPNDEGPADTTTSVE